MLRFAFYLTALALLAITSCTTDFEMNAPYKQTTVIYGLLDQSQPVQYVRVQRSFLGKGNALDMAKAKDSSYFQPSDITVQIEKLLGTELVGTVTLHEEKVNLNPGTFASDSVLIYATNPSDQSFFVSFPPNTTPLKSQDYYVYQLVVTNIKTGTKVTSKTNLIPDFTVLYPGATSQSVAFRVQGKYVDPVIRWNAARFGKIYELKLRFFYTNFDPQTGERVDTSYIDFTQPTTVARSLEGNEELSQKIFGEVFYNVIRDSLTARDLRNGGKYVRYANNNPQTPTATPKENVWFEFHFTVGNEDLNTYINVNAPATGIVQERPLFTNVTGGIGLFASRSKKVVRKKVERETNDELVNGNITNGLFKLCGYGTSYNFCQ